MSKFVKAGFQAKIRTIRGNAMAVRDDVQEALIEATYYCMKDSGTVEPLNQILDAVGDATRVAGLTAWAELFAPVIVRGGKFALNKTAYKGILVNNEADFAEYENAMRAAPKWYAIVEPEKRESIWKASKALDNADNYLVDLAKKATLNNSPETAQLLGELALVLRIKRTELATGDTLTGGK